MSRPLKLPEEYSDKINKELEGIIQFIVKKRKSLGMTQADVSELMGCEITTVQSIENLRKFPSTKTLLLMMKVLKIKFELK